jgi:alcohol dehydrogenase
MGVDVEPIVVSPVDLIVKRIRVIGSQQNGPEYLYEALDFVAQGKVKTMVETYPLAEAAKAYDRVVEGQARFRAVLTM